MSTGLRVKGTLLFLAVGLAGCETLTDVKHWFDPDRVDRADKAGSVHVAVLAVAPWDKVKEDLQPKFELTPAQAYDQAIPVTQQLIERVLDALSASLRVALPTHTVAQSSTRTETTGQASTETATRTEERTPGDPSKVQAGSPPSGSVPAPFSAPPALDSRAVDPMLRYQAATALYQEVKILNQYVANAMKREGYTPYLVRLQVSVLPNRRNLPYDTYANVAFYSAEERLRRSVQLNTLGGGSRMMGPTSLFATVNESAFRGDKEPSARTLLMQHPIVIPLLVTDNLESLLHESAIQTVRQSALGLLAVLKGIGIGANTDSLTNDLQAALGKDLNSLLTVARMSDNTVRVRLGAMSQVESGHAMIPRTHNISLMVLVPNQVNHVKVMTEAEFRDVESGKALAQRNQSKLLADIKGVWNKYDLPALRNEDYFRVANAIYFNDFAGFSELMTEMEQKVETGKPYPFSTLNLFTYLWVDLVGTRAGSSFSQAGFDVPKSTPAPLATCPEQQTPVLFDDGSSTSAALHSGNHLDPAKMTALLTVACAQHPNYDFAPEQLAAAAEGKTLRLSFSSLKALLPAACLQDASKTLRLTLRNCAPMDAASAVAEVQKKMRDASSAYAELEDRFQVFLDRRKTQVGSPPATTQVVTLANITMQRQTIDKLQSASPTELELFVAALGSAVGGVKAAVPATQPPHMSAALWKALKEKFDVVVTQATAAERLVSASKSELAGIGGGDAAVLKAAKALSDVAKSIAQLGMAVDAASAAAREETRFEARYTEKPAPVAAPLALSATQIVATEAGEGSVFVVVVEKFDASKEVRLLRLSGGDFKDSDPKLTREGSGWKLAPGSAVTLTLRNLNPLTEVSLWATNDKGAAIGKPIQVKVVQPAKKEPR